MSKSPNATVLRISGIYGMLAPIIAFTFIFVAVGSHPPFSLTSNALSDLGVVNGVTSGVFNGGLIICGVLCLNFTIGLYLLLRENVLGRVGIFIFALACIALVAIGTFPESVAPMHYMVSVAFFVFLPVSLLIIAVGFWRIGAVRMSFFTLLVAAAAVVPWVLLFTFHYVSGVAIPEALSGLAGSIWVVVLGYKMLKSASKSNA